MSISLKKMVQAAIVISLLAAALILPDASFADCLDPEADYSPEERACISGVADPVIPEVMEKQKSGGNSGLSLNDSKITIPMMVIVVGLNNIDYEDYYDWSEPMFGDDDSVRDFYMDMSYEKLEFVPVSENSRYGGTNSNLKDKTNDGIIHVRVNRNHRDWGRDDTANKAELTRVLCDALESACEYVDLEDYDDNGDGTLTNDELAVAYIIAGYDYGVPSKVKQYSDSLYLRSFMYWYRAAIRKYKVTDYSVPKIEQRGKTFMFDSFVCVPEKMEKENSGTIVEEVGRYGGISHELGHNIGFPDLYDTSSGNSGTRYWDDYRVGYVSLMGHGSWSRDSSGNYRPAPLDPWCRMMYGWLTPQKITSQGEYTVTAQNYAKSSRMNMNKVYRIDTGYTGEYFIIESRYPDKWDSGMFSYNYVNNNTYNKNGGIVIWHIDEKVIQSGLDSNWHAYYDINNPEHRPAIMPLYPEKDTSGGYTMNGTSPESGKPFYDKYLWDNTYKSSSNPNINLPVFMDTSDDYTTRPDERVDSGNHIEFLSNAGRSMDISFIPAGHTHRWIRTYEGLTSSICSNGGWYYLVRTCSLCGESRRSELWHDAGTHIRVRHISAREATCTADGRKEYWWCTTCGKKFLDPELTQETTDADIVIPGGHEYKAVFTQPPTYNDEGIIEYECRICHTGYWDSIPKLDHKDKPGDDGTSCGHGAAIEKADKAIRKSKSEKDMPGSQFSMVRLTSSKQGKRSIKLSWKRTIDYMEQEASRYIVYGAKCGKNKFKKLTTVDNLSEKPSVTIRKIGGKKLSPKTYYKFIVVAVQWTGSGDEVMSTSKTIHVATKGSRAKANHTGVSVSSKAVRKAAQMKEGQTISLKAGARKKSGTKVVPHGKLRYESTDRSVAIVTSKGVIKAKSFGGCRIYVFTQNGKYKAIDVEVMND